VSRIALIRGAPVSWSEAAQTVSQTPMPDRVLTEARDFALRSGFAVPAFSSDGIAGMFAVLSSMEEKAFSAVYEENRHVAHLLAIHLHTRIAALSASLEASAPVRLSGRETEVLLWTSAGKTVWEVSQILDVSVHTVDFHIRNAMRKFGVHSKAQAVAQMIQRRIAQP
jgi:DNA-binding CsgD family transcriptional regulator